MIHPPNFQMTHQFSGEVICYNRLYTEKQLRKALGISKDVWSRFKGRTLPDADTVVEGKSLWTDTTVMQYLPTAMGRTTPAEETCLMGVDPVQHIPV